MDPRERLQLNFGGDYGNARRYEPNNNRVFPTTPSTFPQPVFPNQGGGGPNAYGQATTSPYAGASGPGYFPQQVNNDNRMNAPMYGSQYGQYHQQNVASPQPSYQQRQGAYNQNNPHNDPTSNLAYQFSNQNLGPAPQQPNPYGRQPSPSTRMYHNVQSQQPQQRAPQPYEHYQRTQSAHQQVSSQYSAPYAGNERTATPVAATVSVEDAPEKAPELYPGNIQKRGQIMKSFVEDFFKENISRARERNLR